MPTWLNSQKKARLAELAVICSIGDTEELAEWRKDQLVPALEQILSTNPSIYSKIPAFDEYYQRRNSPIKRGGFHPRASSATAFPATANGARRVEYKAETESSEESASSPPTKNNVTLSSPSLPAPVAASSRPVITATSRTTLPATTSATTYSRPATTVASTTIPATTFARTPSRLQELQREAPVTSPAAAHAPLPPSPAIVTDLIEAQTARFNAEVGEIWASTRVVEIFQQIRTELSSMVGIHLLILGFEFYFLQADVVVWNYLYTVAFGRSSWPIHYPDAFVYLTGYWWRMLLTWQVMSFWIPLVVSWFFNLSLKLKARNGLEYWRPRYKVDPLTFSIAKGVIAWLVFHHGFTFGGLIAEETVSRIIVSQPVGGQAILVSSYIGVATALWDGIQGKKGWQ